MERRESRWTDVVAVVWVVLFLFVFFSQILPNNRHALTGADRETTRWDVWPVVLFKLMDAVDPPREAGSLPRGVMYLGQRVPLWGIAGLIAAGAWGWGTVALHAIGLCLPSPAVRGGRGAGGENAFLVGAEAPSKSKDGRRHHPNPLPPQTAGEGTGARSDAEVRSGLNAPALSFGEQHYFAGLLGLSAVSLVVLGLGLAGWLWQFPLIALLVSGFVAGVAVCRRDHQRSAAANGMLPPRWWLLAIAPFLTSIALGSLSPSTDFDVNEYHLGGPKEWFLAGRITFLPHNVYTSFPFLTEMLLLGGMVLAGDWFWGALAGQAALALFAPLTALGLYCAGRRWHSETAGRMAAIVYLSTPWVVRMSMIAYAEGGLTAYTAGAALAAWWLWERRATESESAAPPESAAKGAGENRWAMLAGLLAGSAMACKYTGLVMAVLPVGAAVVTSALVAKPQVGWVNVVQRAAAFAVGVIITVGPWLLKNTIETRNPVYPLGYSVFGGRDLDDELAEKWRRGHARPRRGSLLGEAGDLVGKAFDVAAVNDWQSPLIGALVPLALLDCGRRRRIVWPAVMTGWLFLSWWLFTHHIDRFWLPLLPTAALVAGAGFAELGGRWSHGVVVVAVAIGWLFDLGFCATGLVGYNAGLTELNAARHLASQITGPEIEWINVTVRSGELPSKTKVLCIGEAELFHAEFAYVYSTVFDHEIFEDWCGLPGKFSSAERPLRLVEEIRAAFTRHGITHIYVNWSEVLRNRTTYGYSDFVHPSRLTALVESGVLQPPTRWPDGLGRRAVQGMSAGDLTAIRQWAPQLLHRGPDGDEFTTSALYALAP